MSDDLERQRREYRYGRLDRASLDADPVRQFARWLNEAIEAQIQDPTAMTVSTVGPGARPWSRIVLLKGFDENGFRFYTNMQSRKAIEISSEPAVALHFPWLQMDRQVIVGGTATPLPPDTSAAYFATRPRESQLAAWISAQSQPIDSRAELETAFNEVSRRFEGEDIPPPKNWGGFVVQPSEFEFWQGGEHRLHDRFSYTRDAAAGWQITRLAP